MKTKKIGNNILFFEFKTQKDMALTFFRVQEFYESKNDNLLNKSFSVFDFIEESMDKNGYLDYFYFWSGFNVPGHIFKKWMDYDHGPNYFTHLEYKLLAEVIDNVDVNDKFYVIATKKKDKITFDHEMAHAFYYTDDQYRFQMDSVTYIIKTNHKHEYKKICKSLSKMGYNEIVYDDEIQAYFSTEKKKNLEEDFKIDYDILRPYIFEYRAILKKSLDKYDIV